MKVNINQELLNYMYSSPLERKIIEVIEMDIPEEDKIKLLVEFLKGAP